jgi:hypothetical protein
VLAVLETHRLLRLTRSGRLLPWLGPALRGLVGMRLKAGVCRQSAADQQTTWRYCKGCPLMAGCAYGETVEPSPRPGVEVFRGQEDGVRPLVIAPDFPASERGWAGAEVLLRALFIGPAAASHAGTFWDAAADAGADARRGLGPDRVTFDLMNPPPGSPRERWFLVDLPRSAEALEGTFDRIRVELTSPLFLRTADGTGRKRLVEVPRFADLLRASLRSLGQLAALFAHPIAADFAGLRAAAEAVPVLRAAFAPYCQPHESNRSGKRSMLRGIKGWGEYGGVPAALVRWLAWGGRLHVGTNRVAGAGGWRVLWAKPDGPWRMVD